MIDTSPAKTPEDDFTAFEDDFTAFKVDQILKDGLESRIPNPHPVGTAAYYEHERQLVIARQEMFSTTLPLLQTLRKRLVG